MARRLTEIQEELQVLYKLLVKLARPIIVKNNNSGFYRDKRENMLYSQFILMLNQKYFYQEDIDIVNYLLEFE